MHLNENFKKWFSSSKVVNSNGEPLVVYHGTDAEFNVFSFDKKGSNTGWSNTIHGFFFIANKELAENFARENNNGGKINVKEVYLSIQKPMDLRRESFFNKGNQAVDIVAFITGSNDLLDEKEALDWLDQEIGIAEFLELPDILHTAEFNTFLISKGYDGIVSDYGGNNLEYVTFKPNQIKSAIGNNGNFDINDDDITK